MQPLGAGAGGEGGTSAISSHGLTLLVPSYKRPGPLAALLGRVRETGIWRELDVIVADDGPDADVQKVAKSFEDCNVRLFINERNIGYSRNLIRLFRVCTTEYAVLSADDDLPDGEQLRFLLAAPADFAMAVTTYRRRDGAIYRSVKEGFVEGRHFRHASNHAPGIVYNIKELERALIYLEKRLDEGCDFALTYPQVVILMYLLCEGRTCRWLPLSPVNEGAAEPSGVLTSKGVPYFAASARLQEFFGVWSILDELETLFPGDPTGNLAAMRREHNAVAYGLVAPAVLELNGFDADLWRGAAAIDAVRNMDLRAIVKLGVDRAKRRLAR